MRQQRLDARPGREDLAAAHAARRGIAVARGGDVAPDLGGDATECSQAEHRPKGRPARGTTLDVMSETESDLDPVRDASREMERLLLDVLGNMPGTSITVFDRRLRVLLMSGSAPKEMGIDPATATGRSLSELMSPAEFVRLEPIYRATLAGESRTDEQSNLGSRRRLVAADRAASHPVGQGLRGPRGRNRRHGPPGRRAPPPAHRRPARAGTAARGRRQDGGRRRSRLQQPPGRRPQLHGLHRRRAPRRLGAPGGPGRDPPGRRARRVADPPAPDLQPPRGRDARDAST